MLRRHAVLSACRALLLATAATASMGAAPPNSLLDAVRAGDAQSVRSILRQKVDVNQASADGTTPLHYAVHRDDQAMVDLLIKAGANVKAVNRYGVPPIAVAAVNGHAGIMNLLLHAGAEPNIGLTPATP